MSNAGETLKKILPNWLLVAAIRTKDALRSSPGRTRALQLYQRLGRPRTVLSGPFRGMAYYPESRGWVLGPKLLGIYEKELHPTVESIVADAPDLIIDVGSAEGYYALGFATRLPAAKVLCYDTDRYANHLLRTNIRLNGAANRLELRGFCSPEVLQRTLAPSPRPLVICDCEGFEDVLLDPAAVPHLAKTRILVELHDFFCAGVTERIRARFSATHNITAIPTAARTPADWPATAPELPADEMAEGMNEHRPCPMNWFYLTPRG